MDMQQAAEAVDHDRMEIAGIVASLVALLGLMSGTAPARISFGLRSRILRILRPAESAVRRLIVILAKSLKLKAAPPRPAPAGLVRADRRNRRMQFRLFDPRQRFLSQPVRPRIAAQAGPRIRSLENGGLNAAWRRRASPDKQDNEGDGLIDSANLVRRLRALQGALSNLPRQARRLVRALDRRSKSERLKRQSPLRPGAAPGFRRRPGHDIDHILARCQWRARAALALDTS